MFCQYPLLINKRRPPDRRRRRPPCGGRRRRPLRLSFFSGADLAPSYNSARETMAEPAIYLLMVPFFQHPFGKPKTARPFPGLQERPGHPVPGWPGRAGTKVPRRASAHGTIGPVIFLAFRTQQAASLPGAKKNLTQRAQSDDKISYLCRGRRKARLRRPSGRYAFRWKVPLKRRRFREPPLPAP
jgi:hypothetical protein